MQVDINGVKITLTKEQIQEIGNQTRKQRPITERINSWKDILDELGIDESFLPYKNPKTPEEKSINAQAKLFKITEAYNEGAIVDWKNTNQYKYIPYKYFSGSPWSVVTDGWIICQCYASGLYYKSRQLAEDAVKKFRDIYDDYWMQTM